MVPAPTAPSITSVRRIMKIIATGAAAIIAVLALAACSSGTAKTSGSTPVKTTAHAAANTPTQKAVSTPSPTESPLVAPVTFSGTSDDVATIAGGLTDARLLAISYTGAENFVVQSLDSAGQMQDLIVNTIGAYNGKRLILPQAPISAFKVTASGPWSMTLEDVRTARTWNGATPLTGTGDDVIIEPGSIGKMVAAKIVDAAADNFIVKLITSDGTDSQSDLLVNEIGPWSGTEAIPAGTVSIEVQASGAWSISPTA